MIRENAPPPVACSCPPLVLEEWEGRRVVFQDAPFLVRRVPRVLGLSVGLEEEIAALRLQAEKLALPPGLPPMLLERDRGFFKGELLLALGIDRGPENIVRLDGTYLATVCRLPHEALGAARARFIGQIRKERGVTPNEVFYWYTDCPRCRPAHGGPITIVLARIGMPEL
jgi:hypothetical protein